MAYNIEASTEALPALPPGCARNHITEPSFWCDGVLVSVIGAVGLLGNFLAIVVLSRKNIRDLFHRLLLALAAFDMMYIVFGGVSYTFFGFSADSDIFTYLFPYVIHPFSYISLTATIFMTVAITIERYLGLCHPFLPPSARRTWFYIVPVVVISVSLNIPKFMEIKLEERTFQSPKTGLNFTRPSLGLTPLRVDPTYIRVYTMWTRLISTAVIPVAILLVLNVRIIIDLVRGSSGSVQRFGSFRQQRREINTSFVLLCIVLIFFCCHAARIIQDVHEFNNVEKMFECEGAGSRWLPGSTMQALKPISHVAMILNSSVNFIVYCLVGNTFRREMCRMFGIQRYASVPQVETMTTDYPGCRSHKVSTVATVGNGIVLTSSPRGDGSGVKSSCKKSFQLLNLNGHSQDKSVKK